MHNIKNLQKNLKIFKKKLSDRNFNLEIDMFENLDSNNRKLISEKRNSSKKKEHYQNQEIRKFRKIKKNFNRNFKHYQRTRNSSKYFK